MAGSSTPEKRENTVIVKLVSSTIVLFFKIF